VQDAALLRVRSLWPALLLVACACALYARSLPAPFVFDDVPSLVQNESLRALWPPGRVLWAPAQTSLAGRPLASLSFALSYALFGLDPRGWRAENVLLHAACALLLFGLARRSFLRVTRPAWIAANARGLALAVALVWCVHPLATEAVVYVTQRTELLMSAALLTSLYAAARGFARERAGRPAFAWFGLSAGAVWLGVGAKEVMAAAPPLLLLYDRAFEAGSFGAAWRRHRALHAAAFASWLALALLVASGPRDATVGFGLPISAGQYALTQIGVSAAYLRLSLWPAPLVISHDWPLAQSVGDVWPSLCVVGALLAATLWACVRRPQLGFLGAWFFLILAPTSSVVPIVSELAAERRMYLPLAAPVAGVVLVCAALLHARVPRAVPFALAACAALVLATVSALRLEVYRSQLALWTQVMEIYPNHRLGDQIESQIGQELARENRLAEALPHFERSVELGPETASNWQNLGIARLKQGAFDAAIEALTRASELAPDAAASHSQLGLAYGRVERWSDAEVELERALELDATDQTARKVLARVLVRLGEQRVMKGDLEGAVPRFQRAQQLDPSFQAAQQDLGETLMRLQLAPPGPPAAKGRIKSGRAGVPGGRGDGDG